LITGVWLVDTVSAGNDGLINISCRDVGRLLLEQFAFPPIIPNGLYPLEYYPAGKSYFDSEWAPKPKLSTGNASTSTPAVNLASRGPVKMVYDTSSSDIVNDSSNFSYNISVGEDDLFTGKGSDSVDGDDRTYSLSEAYRTSSTPDGTVWFQFEINQEVVSWKQRVNLPI
jgi:hypothetical protein